jgi:hypothetical protein
MKKLIQSEESKAFITVIATISCLALSPIARAVVPPPDGGYPGFNTAEGTNSLKSLTTGVANVGVGWYSLFSNIDGSFNTGVGVGTLLFNVGDQSTSEGLGNTAVGAAALYSTPPAPTTQPLERPPFQTTLTAAPTRPPVIKRS